MLVASRNRQGFTLLELVVSMVIVGVLGTLSGVTASTVFSNMKDSKAELTLTAALRQAQASATFRAGTTEEGFTTEDFEGSALASSYAPGTFASSGLTFTTRSSDTYGQVAYAIEDGGRLVAASMRSETGSCFHSVVRLGAAPTARNMGVDASCTGRAAGVSISGWDPISSPSGFLPDALEDTVSSGSFHLPADSHLQVSAQPSGPWAEGLTLPSGTISVQHGVTIDGTGTLVPYPGGLSGALVSLTPTTGFAGPVDLWVRSLDAAGNISLPVLVSSEVLRVLPPSAPTGVLPPGPEAQRVTGNFITNATSGPSWRFEVASSPAGPWSDTDLSLVGVGVVDLYDTQPGRTSTGVAFTPEPGFVGDGAFWMRVTDGASRISAVTAVPVRTTCGTGVGHLVVSVCARIGATALVADELRVSNSTTIYGDVLVPGSTIISNKASFLAATGGGEGTGSLTGGTVSVINGSNVNIAGDVLLSGSFNNSGSLSIDGSLQSSGGALNTLRSVDVAGPIRTNFPNLISLGFLLGPQQVTNGLVAPPATTKVPMYSPTMAPTFDRTFSTWAQFNTWWSVNKSTLGTSGKKTIRVTDTTSYSPDLSGSLSGHLLLVAEGPVVLGSSPDAAPGSSMTVVSRSVSTSAMQVRLGTQDPDLSLTLSTPGTLTFTNRTVMYGNVAAGRVDVNNNTTIHARPWAYWAGRTLVEAS